MTIPLIKTPKQMLFEKAGIPHMQAGGTPPTLAQQQAALAMQVPIKKTTRYAPKNPIIGYRAATNPKHADKTGIETQSTTFDKDKISQYVNAYMDARDGFGLPVFTPQELVNRLLVEGRSDFGFNNIDKNDPKAMKIANSMLNLGHADDAAGFAGALFNKQRIADAHKVPFNVAWNGEGRSKETGLTGWDYDKRMQDSAFAAEHPSNAPLLQHVTQLMQPPVATNEDPNAMSPTNLLGNTDMPQPTTGSAMFAKGGSVKPFRDISKMLIQKHISGK